MVIRCSLLTTLLLCSSATWATPAATTGVLTRWLRAVPQQKKATEPHKVRAGLRRASLLVAAVGSALIITAAVQAQEGDNIVVDIDLDPAYEWVKDGDPAHRLSVLYLRAYTPALDQAHLHPIIYLGDDPNGDAVFIALLLRGHEHDWLSIWGRDGLVQNDVAGEDLEVFADPLGGWSEVNVFVAKGLKGLAADYVPARVENFPLYDIGQGLEMLAWGNSQGELPLLDLRLAHRACNVMDPQGWARVGVGLHSCRPSWFAMSSPFGTPIFHRDKGDLIGFYIAESNSGYRVEGARDEVIAFIDTLELNDNVFAAPQFQRTSPTTWGELKAVRR